ncbi:mini-chromosome maintenance complex-binding protein isoform X1 [Amborella trichopoda]|uniref:Mini-chromosome maintenance complex-binding protein n=1 Tax=Amborella trichopoda TaxID=13333 RepID=W1PBS4_AMBTC|nr:mini-chromosome maintenance complex-binding protein isoform X1 [Amborella trichopoda]ERN05393.1 hypothetical protein AMTR_s00007p00218580 [Amborella trichopoda]|eukprot:XP_020522566.1 mini-chromosome maintenance complex-binding protein isoform X1 [Amborella trichopoda]
MVGPAFDCLANPLGSVRVLFEKAIESGRNPASLSRADFTGEVFRRFLFEEGGLSHVPILDSVNLLGIPPNSLVRFVGMVQDMFDDEYYVGAFKDGSTWRTNKYTDVSSLPMGPSSEMHLWDRRLLYCVPVPGQNSWFKAAFTPINSLRGHSSVVSHQREKRPREPDSMDLEVDGSDPDLALSSHAKKTREEGSSCSQSSEALESNLADCMSSNFDSSSLPCLVKIYDGPDVDIKLNDIFEFIGVFTFDPELVNHNSNHDELSDALCEDVLAHLPPSKVPRLQCIISRRLALLDLISTPLGLQPGQELVKGIREALLQSLTSVLGNDGLAAKYLLLHFLSQIHTRIEPVAVGKLSLNLTGFNKKNMGLFGKSLDNAIQCLLPFSDSIPLSIEYLNTTSLAPKKNYQTNRLVTGALQLAQGTHLTIDETELKAGTLNATGVDNIRILKQFLDFQRVEYEFEYYKVAMDTDVQVLVLSEAKSNILPADLVLPFRPVEVGSYLNASSSELEAWRWYLSTLRSHRYHTIDPAMQKVVQDDMVAARQADRSLGTEELSRWLAMARLMSISYGENSLKPEHWQMVKEMEKLRKERLV